MAAAEKVLLKLRVGHESQLLDAPLSKQGALHTHRWTVFVRAAEGGPLDSRLLQKAVFVLHPDFANPNRVIKSPPFEVTETGYAGFSIPIALAFNGTFQQYNITYDMNLTMEKNGSYFVQQILEFRDPKPALREQLLRFGGYAPPSSSSKPKLSKKPASKPPPTTPVFEKLFGPTISVQPPVVEKRKPSPVHDQKSSITTPSRKVSRTELRDTPDKDDKRAKSTKESSSRSNGSHDTARRPLQRPHLISPSPTHSAPTTPQTVDEGSAQRRPTSSLSGSTPPPLVGDARPIDTRLLIQLAHDFGADERDAVALVAKSEQTALAASTRAQSPIFTADSSPEHQPSWSPPSDADKKRNKQAPALPKRRAPMVANKGDDSAAAKKTATERKFSEPANLPRLLALQKTLMTVNDANLLLRVARLVKEHTTVVAVNDGAALEFDLCLLNTPVIDRLWDLCSLGAAAVRSNGAA